MAQRWSLAVMMALALAGCAVGVKHDYLSAMPTLTVRGGGSVAVGVHDQRDRVISGKHKATWVGESRGGYGNSFGIHTLSGNALADDFSDVVARALEARGFDVTSVYITSTVSGKEACATLSKTGCDKLLLTTLNQWHSDTYQKVRFFYSVTAEVFDSGGQSLAEKKLGFRGPLGAGGMNPPQRSREYVPKAYEEAIESLLNDEEIVAALEKQM